MVAPRTSSDTAVSDRGSSTDNPIPSLFVVSLPRSFSTAAYHVARLALRLDEPAWTSDGEILNNDRFALYGGPTDDLGAEYLHPAVEPESFQRAIAFLDDVTRPAGRAYKDVVQPFAVSAWLPASGLRVLRLRRRVADVAFSMVRRHWLYPARAATNVRGSSPDPEGSVVDGLLRAEQALDALPGEVVDYDAVIADEGVLHVGARAPLSRTARAQVPLHRRQLPQNARRRSGSPRGRYVRRVRKPGARSADRARGLFRPTFRRKKRSAA